jgi:transposase
MGPYAMDLRTRIVQAYRNREGSIRDLAEHFAVAPGTVQDYLRLDRANGSPAPRPHGGGTQSLIDETGLKKVRALVQKQPDATEPELVEDLKRRHGVEVSRQTMGRALQRLKITRKQRRFTQLSETPSASSN